MALPVANAVRRTPPPRPDLTAARIPEHARAVMEGLRFDGDGARLEAMDEGGYRKLLDFCDRAQLTLLLNSLHRDALPAWVQGRIDRNLADYSQRFERLKRSLFEIADVLAERGIEFVLVKGLAHAPDFTPDALL